MTIASLNERGEISIYREFYTIEARIAHFETQIRKRIKWVPVYLPIPAFVGISVRIKPIYLFTIVQDSAHAEVSSGTTTLSYTHTCTGSNLFLGSCVFDQATLGSITVRNYNSVAMTAFANITAPNQGTGRKIYADGIRNPATGGATVDYTRSTSAGGTITVITTSYTGVDQSADPTGAAINTATGSLNDGALACAVTMPTTNCAAYGVGTNNQIAIGAGTNTSIVTTGAAPFLQSSPLVIAASGSFTMNITGTGSGVLDSECMCIVALAPAATAVKNYFSLLGVGT